MHREKIWGKVFPLLFGDMWLGYIGDDDKCFNLYETSHNPNPHFFTLPLNFWIIKFSPKAKFMEHILNMVYAC